MEVIVIIVLVVLGFLWYIAGEVYISRNTQRHGTEFFRQASALEAEQHPKRASQSALKSLRTEYVPRWIWILFGFRLRSFPHIGASRKGYLGGGYLGSPPPDGGDGG